MGGAGGGLLGGGGSPRGRALKPLFVSAALNLPPESDRQAQNLWIIVGVAVPVLVVTVIIVILYWKLCRTDKLDFQPDTISNLQQRQKVRTGPGMGSPRWDRSVSCDPEASFRFSMIM